MKINKEDAAQVLLNRLTCMSQKIDDLVLEVNDLMVHREECCLIASNGLTVDDELISVDDEILTVNILIP